MRVRMICLAVMPVARKSDQANCPRVFHVQNAETPEYGAVKDAKASKKNTAALLVIMKAVSLEL